MVNTHSKFVLGMSNLCVSRGDALQFGADDYVQFLQRAGYDQEGALEVTPTRIPKMMKAMGNLAARGVVGSMQESWRETMPIDIAAAAMRGDWRGAIDEATVILGFPLLDRSYKPLQRIQGASGRRYPLIGHPETQALGHRPPRRPRGQYPKGVFGPAWVQLTAEDIDACQPGILTADVSTLADGIMHINQERSTEVVADLHHVFMKRNGKSFGAEERIIDLIRILHERSAIAEFQLSFRPDFGGRLSELQLVADGAFRHTPQGRTLAAASTVPLQRPWRIISEVRQASVSDLGLEKGTTYLDIHKRLTDGVRTLLA